MPVAITSFAAENQRLQLQFEKETLEEVRKDVPSFQKNHKTGPLPPYCLHLTSLSALEYYKGLLIFSSLTTLYRSEVEKA